MSVDPSVVLVDGPWTHREVTANGIRFHVAEAGPSDGPLVVLLHGFPEFWWSWRHQLVALGGAGFAGLMALIFLSISAAYGISWLGVPLGCAFFTVGAIYLVAAAVLALKGKKEIAQVGPPEKTVETVKDDIAWAKHPTQNPTRATSRT